jgi:hypothetical protein
MRNIVIFIPYILLCFCFSACSQITTPPSSPINSLSSKISETPQYIATADPFFLSSGSGEPRTSGYWLLWNSCAENNQSETARTNGGREAGWILLDDLLVDPGILIGNLQVEACQQGVNLLQGYDLINIDRSSDSAYTLATQLLTAQLNMAVGSEYCQASDQAVGAAQLLLLALNFNGEGSYLDPKLATQDVMTAQILTDQLAKYNTGDLCK